MRYENAVFTGVLSSFYATPPSDRSTIRTIDEVAGIENEVAGIRLNLAAFPAVQ